MQWVRRLWSIGATFNDAVWINVDETALPYFTGGRPGFRMKTSEKQLKDRMVEQSSLSLRRCHCTLISAVSTDPAVQKVLPQILLPNFARQKKAWRRASLIESHTGVRIMLGTNGWSTCKSMRDYFKIIKATVCDITSKPIVMVMDCHPSHIATSTIHWLSRQKWHTLLIPAKLTYLLQPLDACVFRRFKHALFVEHAKQKARTTDGTQSFEEWLEATCTCIRRSFPDLDGMACFKACACSPDERELGPRVSQFVTAQTHCGDSRALTEEELFEVIGARREGLHALLFPKIVSEARPLDRPPSKRLKLTLLSSVFTSA